MRPHLTVIVVFLFSLCHPAAAQLPANRIGAYHGILLTSVPGEDLEELYKGAGYTQFKRFYDEEGKSGFRTGIGATTGFFYQRAFGGRSSLRLRLYRNKHKIVSKLLYYTPSPFPYDNGGRGIDLNIVTNGCKLSYSRLLLDVDNNIFLSAEAGLGLDIYYTFFSTSYSVSRQTSNIGYSANFYFLNFKKILFDPDYFKYTLPVGVSASFRVWKQLFFDIDATYVYISQGSYPNKDAWYYFEDPLHTFELKAAISYGF